MLGCFGSMLGHLVGFIGFHFPWRPPRGENDRIIIILMMRSFLWVSVGPMLGQCWAIWGLSWARVGHLVAYVTYVGFHSMKSLGAKGK